MARVLVLYSLILLSITEAAGATQKSDIQEWPFPAVSELPFASVYFGGAVQHIGVGRARAIWADSGRSNILRGSLNGAIFQLYRREKASIPVTISRRYAAGGAPRGRRGHVGRGGGRPQTRPEKVRKKSATIGGEINWGFLGKTALNRAWN